MGDSRKYMCPYHGQHLGIPREMGGGGGGGGVGLEFFRHRHVTQFGILKGDQKL